VSAASAAFASLDAAAAVVTARLRRTAAAAATEGEVTEVEDRAMAAGRVIGRRDEAAPLVPMVRPLGV